MTHDYFFDSSHSKSISDILQNIFEHIFSFFFFSRLTKRRSLWFLKGTQCHEVLASLSCFLRGHSKRDRQGETAKSIARFHQLQAFQLASNHLEKMLVRKYHDSIHGGSVISSIEINDLIDGRFVGDISLWLNIVSLLSLAGLPLLK